MKVVITSANRTPIVTIKRGLSLNVQILGNISIKAALDVSWKDPYIVYDVILGNVLTAGIEPTPCTQSAIYINCSDKSESWVTNALVHSIGTIGARISNKIISRNEKKEFCFSLFFNALENKGNITFNC